MSDAKNDYFCVGHEIVSLHSEVAEYAVCVNQEIAAANGGVSTYPLCGAALYSITADLLGIHRSIMDLCRNGWAFVTVVLIRSMMDIYLSALVLTENKEEAEYRGVKYTHSFLKASINTPGLNAEKRKAQRAQIDAVINRAPAIIKERLHSYFFKEPIGAYWFHPEYRRPSDIAKRLAHPEIVTGYRFFSGGSHGSYLGLRILKDQPDNIHPNPRSDPRSQELALKGSSRLLLETMHLRDIFENHGRTKLIYESILGKIKRPS